MHKFDRTKYEEAKEARKELEKPHSPPASVAALRERVQLLEKVAGIKNEL